MPSHQDHSLTTPNPSPRVAAPSMQEANDLYGKKEFHIYQNAIENMQANADQLPSLPVITLEIRKATSNPNVNIAHLSALITRDPSLTAILMKHASSVFYRSADKPKNLQDVIKRLGMHTVENLTLAHSIKSLFVLRDHNLKALYKQAWQRQTLKACTSYYLAKSIRFPNAEDAMVASLLSEVGTLTLLAALQNHDMPAEETYKILCQHYSKHLGAILLAKWGVAPIFMEVLRKTGAWTLHSGNTIQLADIINLGLFHTIHYLKPQNDLMPIQELAAYKKLAPQYSMLKNNKLFIIEENLQHIQTMTKLFAQ
jgi:HD-like signal output (HDOD) protein